MSGQTPTLDLLRANTDLHNALLVAPSLLLTSLAVGAEDVPYFVKVSSADPSMLGRIGPSSVQVTLSQKTIISELRWWLYRLTCGLVRRTLILAFHYSCTRLGRGSGDPRGPRCERGCARIRDTTRSGRRQALHGKALATEMQRQLILLSEHGGYGMSYCQGVVRAPHFPLSDQQCRHVGLSLHSTRSRVSSSSQARSKRQ